MDKQEPVATLFGSLPVYDTPTPCKTCEALARAVMMDQTSHDTAPPQREWIGLTDEEMFAALVQVDPLTKRLAPGFEYFARAIEAKLREKNG